MSGVTQLHRVNGGTPSDETDAKQCENCKTWLGKERAVASSPSGTKFFCKQEPGDSPHDSCFLQWRRKRH